LVKLSFATNLLFMGYFSLVLKGLQVETKNDLQEERFEAIIKKSSDILMIMDKDGTARFVSPSIETQLGYKPDEIIGKSIFDFVHPDSITKAADQLKESLLTPGASRTMEINIRHKNGSWHIVEGTGTNLLDDPLVKGFVVNCRDVTERTRATEILSTSENRLRAFLDSTSDIAFLKNTKHEYVMVNKTCMNFFGKTESEIIGKTDFDLMPDSAAENCFISDKATLASGKLTINREAIGRQVFETRKFPFVLGNETYIGAIIRDFTEINQATENLRISEERYRTLVESASDAIVMMSEDGTYISVNNAAAEGLGGTTDNIIGKNIYDTFPKEIADFQMSKIKEVFKTGMPVSVFGALSRTILGDRWFDTALTPVKDTSGRIICVLGIARDVTLRKQNEEMLMELNETLRTIIQTSPLAIIILDSDGNVVNWNKAADNIFGWSEHEVTGRFFPTVPENKISEFQDIRKHVLGGKVLKEVELDHQRKDGSLIRIGLSAAPLFNSDGDINGIMILASDKTEKMQAVSARIESEERFRRLAENAPDIILRWVSGFGVEYVNPALKTITGYSPEEVIGNTGFLAAKLHPDDRNLFFNAIKKAVSEKESGTVEFRFISKSNETIWGEARLIPIPDEKGSFTTMECLVRDITHRKKSESENRQNYEIQFILNVLLHISLADMLFDDKLESFLNYLVNIPWLSLKNKGAIFMTGDEPGILKMKVQKNLPGILIKHCSSVPFGKCICGRAAQSGDITFTDRIDSRHDTTFEGMEPHGHYCVPIRSSSRTLGVIALYLDEGAIRSETNDRFLGSVADIIAGIIERKRTEDEKDNLQNLLLQAQKMEAIGTLAGGIAHDFNNMLAVIMGNAQMGTMSLEPNDTGYIEFNEITNASERAKDLTMKLLTFARKEKIDVKTVSIDEILKELVSVLERSITKKIKIKIQTSDNLPPVKIDVNQIYQAFLNICNNACDAMPSGGVLTIESEEVTLDDDYCKKHIGIEPGRYCSIRISDTGIGMTDDVARRIFEPFFTTKGKGKGTGLGLSVTIGVIQNHGGYIHVNSEPGKGTVMNIHLPFSGKEAEKSLVSSPEEIQTGSESILIIDDEKNIINIAKKMLKKAGYNVLTAETGLKAIKLFEKKHENIDLILLDMIMPEMDAAEIYNALKTINPSVKIVLFSGYSIDGQAGKLIEAGIQGFLQKPFTMIDLCRTVRQVLDNP
jgi:two-component system, cell cycle sensor histidine kinase and response regulator CckA